jgi:hypothetical protein
MSDLPVLPDDAEPPRHDLPPQQTTESGNNLTIRGNDNRGAGRDYYEKPTINPPVMTCPPMPPRPPKFGGRDEELALAAQAVTQKRRVAITALHGMGGLGKTTLAQELAHSLCDSNAFQVVVWTVVGPDRDVRSVLEEWARRGDSHYNADYTRPPDPQTAKANLTDALREKCRCEPQRTLVLVDDVWSLDTALILREATPDRATLLITTRFANIAGELDQGAIRLGMLAPQKAVLFLREYLPQADEEVLLGLTDALHGHPLALKIAATRAINILRLPGQTMAGVLQAHTEQYRKGVRDEMGDSKETSLKVSLDYSYRDLTAENQRRFRALGVLAKTDFTSELLAALWEMPVERVGEQGCLPLINASLLEATDEAGVYQDYVTVQLKDSGDEASALARYAEYVIPIAAEFNELPL